MNLTKVYCISNSCFDKQIVMHGAGGHIGSGIDLFKLHCPECGITIMIIPMQKGFDYTINKKPL